MKTILVTGASGFIGSYIVSEALSRGYEVWAGMREGSSKRYLKDPALHFAYLDMTKQERLTLQLRDLKQEMGGRGWDYVVHAAGATKSLTRDGFFKTNTECTRNLVKTLKAEDMVPERFVYMSSLSIFGAIREEPVRHATERDPWVYAPIRATDTPMPNTAYGESKLEAEKYLPLAKPFPYVILRPTGVYGPREKDYYLMAQSIASGVDFAVGFRRQEITFIYVMDLVDAVFLALTAKGVEGKAYFLSDGQVYHSRRFSDLLQEAIGRERVHHIVAPLWLLWIVCAVGGLIGQWRGRLSALNLDKYHILSQRNWQCDITPARRELGFEPKYTLEKGVRETVEWYKREGWL